MSQQFNRAPTYAERLITKGETTRDWYQFFSGLGSGQAFGLPSAVPLAPSPMTYQAPTGGTLIIQGGSVSMVSFTRDGVTNFNTGQTQGMLPLSQRDQLIIIYTGTPVLTFIPR